MPAVKKVKSIKKKSVISEVKKVSRPWQGTILAIFNILGLLILGLSIPFVLLLSISSGLLGTLNPEVATVVALIGGFGLIISLVLILFFILGVFITIGLFKGQKWVIVLLLIFSVLNMFTLTFNFDIFSFILLSLFAYLEISCLTHPFYNKK